MECPNTTVEDRASGSLEIGQMMTNKKRNARVPGPTPFSYYISRYTHITKVAGCSLVLCETCVASSVCLNEMESDVALSHPRGRFTELSPTELLAGTQPKTQALTPLATVDGTWEDRRRHPRLGVLPRSPLAVLFHLGSDPYVR